MTDESGEYRPERHCPFCRPDPRRVIARLGLVNVLWDGFPVSQGHALVVPVRHVSRWDGLAASEKIALFDGIDRAKAAISELHSPDGFNLGVNDGEAAGQTIMHVHLHVIPRYAGDQPDPRGGIRWVIPEMARYWEASDADG